MIKISPSILSCDFANAARDVARVENAGAEYLHLDVMDGMFVPNISFGAPVIKALRPHSKTVFDTHLMINEPGRYINDFVKAGSDIITVHYESCADVGAVIRQIHDAGVRAGLSIKPKTPVSVLEPFMSELDLILIMSVEPGFGGQKFIPESLDKIREVKALTIAKNVSPDIEVDGGINIRNHAEVIRAGANVLVAGSAVFGADDPAAAVAALKKI